jgi:hypothetical protein
MIAKKKPLPRKPKADASMPSDWREAIRTCLAKVRDVSAVFVCEENQTIHVYSVIPDFTDAVYKRLLKQEALVEKAFPNLSFEFHARVHQGQEPHFAVPHDAALVFQR